jgi:hypothetical protein
MPDYNELIETIDKAINGFNDSLPKIQKEILADVLDQIKKFDTRNKRITNTVKNIRLLNTIKNRLKKIILTDQYKGEVKEFLKVFTDVSTFQNEYFKEAEKKFSPPKVVKEIKKQTITDTINRLTEAGIGVNVSDKIAELLKQNVTTGVKYSDLAAQLREYILTTETPGVLERYVKQIATDSVNQYSAQYMNTISGDLGYEWFRYQGKDILTTRPFCDAMTDRKFFHISEVPDLLEAKDLYYSSDAGQVKVPIYEKTGLPNGMIPDTNVENFFIRRGGYNCGHQIFPVIERLVPKDIQDRVKATAAYKRFHNSN